MSFSRGRLSFMELVKLLGCTSVHEMLLYKLQFYVLLEWCGYLSFSNCACLKPFVCVCFGGTQ